MEGVKVILKPELHLYRQRPMDDPFLGQVPVTVRYHTPSGQKDSKYGILRYDKGKRIFITALSDFVPTNPQNTELLGKYARGMSEVARVYWALLNAQKSYNINIMITEKNFYRDSQGEWKDIGNYWLYIYSDDELKAMADAVK